MHLRELAGLLLLLGGVQLRALAAVRGSSRQASWACWSIAGRVGRRPKLAPDVGNWPSAPGPANPDAVLPHARGELSRPWSVGAGTRRAGRPAVGLRLATPSPTGSPDHTRSGRRRPAPAPGRAISWGAPMVVGITVCSAQNRAAIAGVTRELNRRRGGETKA